MKKVSIDDIPLSPMMAKLVDEPFDDDAWIFEVKWDGYRLMARCGNPITLISRGGIDVTKKYAPVAQALARVKERAILDGELVAIGESGRPSFQAMQRYGEEPVALVYYAFDLLFLDGEDLRDHPLTERKQLLKKILPKSDIVRFSEHIHGRGEAYFAAAQKEKLEGIMAKRASSSYHSGKRTDDWLKIKTSMRQEVVIVGFTEPRNSRKHIGSLILAVRDGKDWRYVGHTGGGMGGMSLKEMHERLEPLVVPKAPLTVPSEVSRAATWVCPKLVGEVKFGEWTEGGTMRHPVFMGLRSDKRPTQVKKEEAQKPPRLAKTKKSAEQGELTLSNLEKVYWPTEGYTKGDLIAYYDAHADLILPYLKDRPFVLNRHPNGISKPGFYQKDVDPKTLPSFVETAIIHSESNDKNIHYVVCNNKETLLYLANLGCIELNPWNSRVDALDNPDFYVIDLDPGTNTFDQVIEVAQIVHEVLEMSCEESYPKTSGKSGLHIYVPLKGKYSYERIRSFAELLVRIVHQRIPEITSIERSPAKRRDKIYLDWLQNRVGQTLAAPYSLRPAAGATVSTPLEWKEVKKGLTPEQFTIRTIDKRLKKKGDLWKPVLGKGIDLHASIACLERELSGSLPKKHARLRAFKKRR